MRVGELSKTPYKRVEQKREEGTQIFKKGGVYVCWSPLKNCDRV